MVRHGMESAPARCQASSVVNLAFRENEMRTALFMAALLMSSSLAIAADPRCPVTLPQAELNDCFEKAADETAQRLDGLLKELRATLTGKNWALMKESHALWAKSRAMDCKVEASFAERPIRSAVTYGCIEKRTRERMHQLRYYLCPRYDLTGQCDAERLYE
jgi:uncharacterized protein YecT (DUF1311 family)